MAAGVLVLLFFFKEACIFRSKMATSKVLFFCMQPKYKTVNMKLQQRGSALNPSLYPITSLGFLGGEYVAAPTGLTP